MTEEVDAREAGELAMRAQQLERAERVRAPPRERHALIFRQRLRQDQPAIEEVGEAEAGRDPERQARVDAAGKAADRRPEDEARAEGDAENAEARGALLGRGHVRDVGEAGREARAAMPEMTRPRNSHHSDGASAIRMWSSASPRHEIRITGRRP